MCRTSLFSYRCLAGLRMICALFCCALVAVTSFAEEPDVARQGIDVSVPQLVEMLRADPSLAPKLRQAIIAGAHSEGRIVAESELTDAELVRMVQTMPEVAGLLRKEASRLRPMPETGGTPTDARAATSPLTDKRQIAGTESSGAANRVPLGVTDSAAPTTSQATEKNGELPPYTVRPNPYANVPALTDLYSQVVHRDETLVRFGMEIFRNGTGNADGLPMDIPVGSDYVVGTGDELNIEVWGGMNDRLQRIVDREGKVSLPEVGPVSVSGLTLGDAQQAMQASLRSQVRNVQVEVSLARLRTVRVYVVGDVVRPGAYDISALSTPLNALYAAGGPSIRGSMRDLRHFRGDRLVQEVDVYGLILHGVRSGLQRMESGDTILIPPIGDEITVEGMVRRPAVYELRNESKLSQVLEMAGGVLPSAAVRHIEIERLEAHNQRSMASFDLPDDAGTEAVTKALNDFVVQAGDRIRISPILPYARRAVYLDGHVFNPGKYPWHEGMSVADLVRSSADLLPEPYRKHAEIIRLNPQDYRPQIIGFNLGDVLDKSATPIALQPFDTVRIFGRYEFEDRPQVTVSGEVRSPGVHDTNGETRLSDAIYLAGGLTRDALLDNVHIFRQVEGGSLKVLSADLSKAMAGNPVENVLLMPLDQVIVHRNPARVDPKVVFVRGQVVNPGRYPLSDGMTASELVRLAGGLRRGAYTETADLARFNIGERQSVQTENRQVRIAAALSGVAADDIELRDGDVLSIRQISGWEDIGASVTIHGEVAHAGTYGITPGERLSSVLRRAGGFNNYAYPDGAVLKRAQVKEFAEKTKSELIARLESEMAQGATFSADSSAEEQAALMKSMQQQQKQVIDELKKQDVDGRLVVHISSNLDKWAGTPDDIEVRDGDLLIIPKKPTFVLVSGQVHNPAAISYRPGKNAGWYLRNAGGPTEMANKKEIFVVRADGSVVAAGSGGWWSRDVLSTTLKPGDSVVVPNKIMGGTSAWRALLGTAQIISSLGITARVIAGF